MSMPAPAVALRLALGLSCLVLPALGASVPYAVLQGAYPYTCDQYREDGPQVALQDTAGFSVRSLGKFELETTPVGARTCPGLEQCAAYDPARYVAVRQAAGLSGPFASSPGLGFWIDGAVYALIVNLAPANQGADGEEDKVVYNSLVYDYYNATGKPVARDEGIESGGGTPVQLEFCYAIPTGLPDPATSFSPLPLPTPSAKPSVCTDLCVPNPLQNKCHYTTSCAPGPNGRFFMCVCRPGYKLASDVDEAYAWRFNSSDWTIPGHDHRVFVNPGAPCEALCDGVGKSSDPDRVCDEVPIYDDECGLENKAELFSHEIVIGVDPVSNGASFPSMQAVAVSIAFVVGMAML